MNTSIKWVVANCRFAVQKYTVDWTDIVERINNGQSISAIAPFYGIDKSYLSLLVSYRSLKGCGFPFRWEKLGRHSWNSVQQFHQARGFLLRGYRPALRRKF